jgi:acetyl-CoA C-acetyltransferase
MQNDVFIVNGTRTPVGDHGGFLFSLTATDLGVLILQSLIERSGLNRDDIERVYMGNCLDPVASNIARIAAVKAGLPKQAPGITVSCTCGSAMQAVAFGVQSIAEGDADIVIAGGVESMSNAPYVCDAVRWGKRLRHAELSDLVWKQMQEYPLGSGMGLTAENVAERDGISRIDQDELALTSQKRAVAAIQAGKFKDEITPVRLSQKKGDPVIIDTDEHPRADITMEKLSRLPPIFKKGGTVTAGNSSGINDGASAVLLMSGDKVKTLGLKPMGRIVTTAAVGVDPDYMGDGPVPATRLALKKAGLTLQDIGLIEINEAFAAQYLSCERALELNREITNVNGSGIALGHPVGSTGARLIVTLVHEMQKRKTTYGLASLCAGGGHGFSTIVERV